jgi:hypothetical protein
MNFLVLFILKYFRVIFFKTPVIFQVHNLRLAHLLEARQLGQVHRVGGSMRGGAPRPDLQPHPVLPERRPPPLHMQRPDVQRPVHFHHGRSARTRAGQILVRIMGTRQNDAPHILLPSVPRQETIQQRLGPIEPQQQRFEPFGAANALQRRTAAQRQRLQHPSASPGDGGDLADPQSVAGQGEGVAGSRDFLAGPPGDRSRRVRERRRQVSLAAEQQRGETRDLEGYPVESSGSGL